eukprot:scaffold86070_cov40-Phaeocystis_antarctica.AAC.2
MDAPGCPMSLEYDRPLGGGTGQWCVGGGCGRAQHNERPRPKSCFKRSLSKAVLFIFSRPDSQRNLPRALRTGSLHTDSKVL